jgi:hypothetical protein
MDVYRALGKNPAPAKRAWCAIMKSLGGPGQVRGGASEEENSTRSRRTKRASGNRDDSGHPVPACAFARSPRLICCARARGARALTTAQVARHGANHINRIVPSFHPADKAAKQVSDTQPDKRPCKQHHQRGHQLMSHRRKAGGAAAFYDDIMKPPGAHRPWIPRTAAIARAERERQSPGRHSRWCGWRPKT